MSDCYCDYGDTPKFYNATTPRANKSYRCDECSGWIMPGERYERVSALWYGDRRPHNYITCERCTDMRQWVTNNVPCLCWAHGGGDDSLFEAIDDAYKRAGNEVTGLKFGFLRLLVKRKHHNAAAGSGR